MKTLAHFFLWLAHCCDDDNAYERLRWRCDRLSNELRMTEGSLDRMTKDRDKIYGDLRKYQAAHDRVTNELAHYIATAYSR